MAARRPQALDVEPLPLGMQPAQPAPPSKRARTEGVVVPSGVAAFNHIEDWREVNKLSFVPSCRGMQSCMQSGQLCRAMHSGQLCLNFGAGPQLRREFRLEEGSRFFYQIRGDLDLLTVQRGKRKLVKIRQGQVFILPSRIPFSLQRTSESSFGLEVERQRTASERDGFVIYTDPATCDKVFWEHFFASGSAGEASAVQVLREFEALPESRRPRDWPEDDRPLRQDTRTELPPPLGLDDFIAASKEKLADGEVLPLRRFPDREFQIAIAGGPSEQRGREWSGDTWLYQLRGFAHVALSGGTLRLDEGCCCLVLPGQTYDVARSHGSVGMVLRQDPQANKRNPDEDDDIDFYDFVGLAPAVSGGDDMDYGEND